MNWGLLPDVRVATSYRYRPQRKASRLIYITAGLVSDPVKLPNKNTRNVTCSSFSFVAFVIALRVNPLVICADTFMQ